MAHYIDAKCRLCRREGEKLYLKGDRCFSPKCPIERLGAQIPGQHGKKRNSRLSGFGIQLREKQKVKRTYGVLEKQFKGYYQKAQTSRENTGERLLQLLESRLDNVVYRLGFAPSRSLSRQIVGHGHITVDGKKLDVASYTVKPGQVIGLSKKGSQLNFVKNDQDKKDQDKKDKLPDWLSKKGLVGKMERLPLRDELDEGIKENLIVEFYSR